MNSNMINNYVEINFRGKLYKGYSSLCREYSIDRTLFSNRLYANWSLEECLGLTPRIRHSKDQCRGYIYKITNSVNNKIYIGLTTISLQKRFKRHIQSALSYKSNSKLSRAILKHGPEKFKIEKINSSNSKKRLAVKEKYYIQKFNAILKGYNSKVGGALGSIVGKTIEYKGETYYSLREVCNKFGVTYSALTTRLNRGWTIEDAITGKVNKHITLGNKNYVYKSVRKLCPTLKICYSVVQKRAFKNNITLEEALKEVYNKKYI